MIVRTNLFELILEITLFVGGDFFKESRNLSMDLAHMISRGECIWCISVSMLVNIHGVNQMQTRKRKGRGPNSIKGCL